MDERSDFGSAAGWFPDPVGRFEFRWFNGDRWTSDVSADGRRFIDDMNAAVPATPAIAFSSSHQRFRPSRTLAVLSFVFGVGGLAIAWTPYLFVVGAMGAIASIVLGVVALRRIAAGTADGRRLAIGGLVAAVLALGLCSVGVILTGKVADEVEEYTDPGPVDADVTSCTSDGARVKLIGSVENLDDESHDYVVIVRVDDMLDHRATARVIVDDVAAGSVQQWEFARFERNFESGALQCRIDDVTGPFPFGLPND